ncbi:hypothetical protein D3C83_177330 [compost metagenome]
MRIVVLPRLYALPRLPLRADRGSDELGGDDRSPQIVEIGLEIGDDGDVLVAADHDRIGDAPFRDVREQALA